MTTPKPCLVCNKRPPMPGLDICEPCDDKASAREVARHEEQDDRESAAREREADSSWDSGSDDDFEEDDQ